MGNDHQLFVPALVVLWLIMNSSHSWTMDNGLLVRMTQPTNRTTTRRHCTGQTNHNSEH